MKKPLDLEHRRSPVQARVASGLGQRKCACGESLSLHDECTDCHANRLGLQRRELSQPSASAAASHRLVDPSLGHHFNDVSVHSSLNGASLADPLSDNGGGTSTPTDEGGTSTACPEMKTVSLDFVSLNGSTRDPYADLAFANTVFAPCCVNFTASGQTAIPELSDRWLGGDTVMERATGGCGSGDARTEEIDAYQGAERELGLSGRVRVFYVESSNPTDRGRAVPPSCATGRAAAIPNMLMVTNTAADRTLAHELGHILLDPGSHGMPANNLMHITNTATGNDLDATQCATIFANA